MKTRIFFFITVFTFFISVQAQTLSGIIYDPEQYPYPNAEIEVNGEIYYTDLDGSYQIPLSEGSFLLKIFTSDYSEHEESIIIGTSDIQLDIYLKDKKKSLNEVVVSNQPSQGTESAALEMQREGTEIKEVVSQEQLQKSGVTEAASAVAKISGVVNSERKEGVFVRGLGDRYMSSMINGLPIPSNRDDRRNIELDVIPASFIEDLALSKTFIPNYYANFGAGNININTKNRSNKDYFSIGLQTAVNINNFETFNDFRNTSSYNYFGLRESAKSPIEKLNTSSWDPSKNNLPLDFRMNVNLAKSFKISSKKVSVFFNTEYKNSYEYRTGSYQYYRSNRLRRLYDNTQEYLYTAKLNSSLSTELVFNPKNSIKWVSLFLNQMNDNLFEGGRNSFSTSSDSRPSSYVYDMQPKETSAFYRDQRNILNRIFVNQLIGDNTIADFINIDWAIGYNYLLGNQPNTKTTEAVYMSEDELQFTQNTDYDTSRNFINLKEQEWNGYLNANIPVSDNIAFNLGINGRNKHRNFKSQYIGLALEGIGFQSVDNIDEVLNAENYGRLIAVRNNLADIYKGQTSIFGAYMGMGFNWQKFNINLGARYENQNQNLQWFVSNYPGRYGSLKQKFNGFLPSFNSKYKVNERHSIRLDASKTISMADIKDLSPFEYKDSRGRLFRGNPNLINPDLYNIDLKYEFYPTNSQIFSLTAFGKIINNPINTVQNISAAGYYRPENTGKRANVMGIEIEAQYQIFKNPNGNLSFIFNATRMWTKQDLYPQFQFNDYKNTPLQGAPNYIVNGSFTYETQSKNPWVSTVTLNYSSDKIFSIGSPYTGNINNEIFTFNDNTIERGFVTLDLVSQKRINDKVSFVLTAQNILNPKIEFTQDNNVTNLIQSLEGPEAKVGDATLESYRRGFRFKLGFTYIF